MLQETVDRGDHRGCLLLLLLLSMVIMRWMLSMGHREERIWESERSWNQERGWWWCGSVPCKWCVLSKLLYNTKNWILYEHECTPNVGGVRRTVQALAQKTSCDGIFYQTRRCQRVLLPQKRRRRKRTIALLLTLWLCNLDALYVHSCHFLV